MTRPGRNWVQQQCDSLGGNCDKMLLHLQRMHELYTYGQDVGDIRTVLDPKTGEPITTPAYPEHVAAVEQIIQLVLMLQEIIKQFKQERV